MFSGIDVLIRRIYIYMYIYILLLVETERH